MIIGMLTLLSRLLRSLFTRDSSSFRVLQFFVDGGEFLVSRLQFLFRSFQFLIDALQFLIAGLDFLVCRPNSSFVVRCSSMMDCKYSRVASSSSLRSHSRLRFLKFWFWLLFCLQEVARSLWTENVFEERALRKRRRSSGPCPGTSFTGRISKLTGLKAPSSSTSTPSLRTVPARFVFWNASRIST